MPIVNKLKVNQKKHGKKVFVKPSQKKSVKNGKAQPKQKPKVKKVVKPVKKINPVEQELLDEEDARIESEVEAGMDDEFIDMDETEDNL